MNRIKFLPALFSILFFGSCTHYYYAPNIHNVPLFKEKKDMRISVAASTGGEIASTEVQAAYALTNNIGIMANTMFAQSKNTGDSINKGSGNLFELGIGYYKPLSEKIVFETYLGGGGAKISNTFSNGLTINTNATRLFLQPALGYGGKNFQAAISARISGVNLSKPTGYSSLDSTNRANLDYVGTHASSVMFEPAFTIRLGFNNIKVQFQAGWSNNLNNPKLSQGKTNMSVGLYIDLNKSFWEKMASKN